MRWSTRSTRRPDASTPASRWRSPRTGRLSSTDPNLQNIPIRTEEGSRIRHAFIAEPGHVLVSADYSQIELRLLAHVADIPALSESFARGEDIHARTASEVFGIPMAGHGPDDPPARQGDQFRHHLRHQRLRPGRQLGITPGEARGYIDAYFARYPGIRTYMETHARRRRASRLCRPARSAGAAGCRASPTRTRRGAATPSGRRSTRRCRAARRTSSSARWCGCPRRCARPACARGCCCRCMTNCCSRRRRPRCRRCPRWPSG